MVSLRILLLFLILVVSMTTDGEGKQLKMVHLMYRHGARSPFFYYPNDKTQESDWPDGSGRLTQIGTNMEYNLGKFLKKRYVDEMKFLDQKYLHKQVYIRSSDVERCLQSAEAQLAGLYPPTGYQIWNTKIPWQPIPVHTVPIDEDTMLRSQDMHCPRRDEIWKMKKRTLEFKRITKKSEGLLKLLSHFSGMNITMNNVWDFADTAICERTDNRPVARWVNELWNATIKVAEFVEFYNRFRGSDELGRILGGTFIQKMNDDMLKSIKNIDSDALYKMNIFSGHDTSLMSLAAGLNIDIDVPTFSACIMVELYETEKGYVVEMLLRDLHSLKPLKLKGCGFSCLLLDFKRLTKNRTTSDYQKACGNTPHNIQPFIGLKYLLIAFSSITILPIFVIGFRFMNKVKKARENKHYIHEGELLIPDDKTVNPYLTEQ